MSNKTKQPETQLLCFSFAAYAKTLIAALRASNIPVAAGLSDAEFTSVETLLAFTFPPDLRAVLREGLPISAGFPNWRSSSPRHLAVLLSLPRLLLLRRVSRRTFWSPSWGPRPGDDATAVEIAGRFLGQESPVLVPIFRDCYVAATPCDAGNPVFHIGGDGVVRVLSHDIAGFYRELGFVKLEPVWAAKEAKRVEFWTEVATAHEGAWWGCDGADCGVGECMERVLLMLREGGWKEEEVKEMMAMGGGDGEDLTEEIGGGEGVTWQLKRLSAVLLRAGWSVGDVAYSLGTLELRNDDKECVVF